MAPCSIFGLSNKLMQKSKQIFFQSRSPLQVEIFSTETLIEAVKRVAPEKSELETRRKLISEVFFLVKFILSRVICQHRYKWFSLSNPPNNLQSFQLGP